MRRKKIKIKAIKVNYNDSEFFLTSINAKKLFNMSVVTRAEEDPEQGYQRILGKSRAKKIAQYLDDGNMIPGALILSSIEKTPDYNVKTHELVLIEQPNSLLVIDGQHRLYGAFQSNVDVEIPVCIFFGLDKQTEVQYFIDVNGYQMGVPKTLRLELQKFTAEENSEESILKALFDELDQNSLSPLAGKMARTKSVSGKISHVAFQNAMKPILSSTPFNSFSIAQKKKVIINFFLALETILNEIFEDTKKISNAAFFQGVLGAFSDICHITYASSGSYKQDGFEETLKTIQNINWELHTGTNKSAIKALTEDIRSAISNKNTISDELF